jgi:hypothetical protein
MAESAPKPDENSNSDKDIFPGWNTGHNNRSNNVIQFPKNKNQTGDDNHKLNNVIPFPQQNQARSLQDSENSQLKTAKGTVANQEDNVISGIPWGNNVTGQRVSSKSGAKLFLKKRGPMMAIILTLVGGGIGFMGLLSPSLLIINIKEVLFQKLDDAAPALSIRTNKMLYKKFTQFKGAFNESSDGKCNIKCKFGTMSETMKRNFEANGFEFENAEEGTGLLKGRWTFDSVKFPDGHEVFNGDDLGKALADEGRASLFQKVFNSKTSYFLNSKFGSVLKEKFGLNKLSEITQKLKDKINDTKTSIKDKVKESLREALGLPAVDPNVPNLSAIDRAKADPRFKPMFDAITSVQAKATAKAGDVAGWICTAYDVMKGVTFATKAAKIAAFAAFAMIFLNAADQIKAGDADPAVISALGDQLTEPDSNGKAATDSLGYRMDAYGDTGTPSQEDQKYSASPSSGLIKILGVLAATAGFSSLSLIIMGKICGVAQSIVTQVATSCPEEIAAAVAAAVGTAGVGAVVPAAICVGKTVVISAVIGTAIGTAIGDGINTIAKSDVPTIDDTTKGTAAGDIMHTGTAQVLDGASASYGLKAGNHAEIKQYVADTANINQEEDKIASYDARNTPLDIYNQYSFLGSIVQKLNIGSLYSSSPLSVLGSIFSIIPTSFASLSGNIGAETDTKSPLYTPGTCNDPGLTSIGVDGDAFCNPSYVMSSSEMNADIDTVTDYMINGKYIDSDTGEALSGDYQEYLDNCANRTTPLGETGESVASSNYLWAIGNNCVANSTELSMFRTYTMDKAINDTMDEI